jgi:hypothetical protein
MIQSINAWASSEVVIWIVDILSQFETQLAVGLLLGAIYFICRAAEHLKPGGDLPSRFGWWFHLAISSKIGGSFHR